jgi:tetratricopeptide (TPR) repeat protein
VVALGKTSSDEVHRHFDLCWNVEWALTTLERYEDSVPYFERAQELDPSNVVGPWALGVALLELAQFDKAESVLLRSIELKSGHLNRAALRTVQVIAQRFCALKGKNGS